MKQAHLFVSLLSAIFSITIVILVLPLTGFFPSFLANAASAVQQTTPNHPHIMKTRQISVASTPISLQYHNGPLMQKQSTTYAIFWEPPTLPDGTTTYVSGNYNNLLQRYFKDIGNSGLYNNNTQYYQITHSTTNYILNSSNFGGFWLDPSTSYPSPSDCTDSVTPHGCMIDSDIQTEIKKALLSNSTWKADLSHVFFVFTSWGEGSCTDSTSSQCAFAGGNLPYCAYHNQFSYNRQTVLYANMPYTGTDLTACGVKTSPNNDFDSDSTINEASHEQMETVTDPLTPNTTISGWWDVNQQEIGDKCAWQFGSVSLDGGKANVRWNGHYYIVQQEWANALSGCTLTYANWAMFGYNTLQTRYNPYEDILNPKNASSLILAWSPATTAGIIEMNSSPIESNGIVYIGDDSGTLSAFNPTTGTLLWNYATGGRIDSAPTVANGIIYVANYNGDVDAINAQTGTLLWNDSFNTEFLGSPTVFNGTVYVGGDYPGNIYALNAITGTTLWENQMSSYIWSTPTVFNGIIYISFKLSGSLAAFNAKTGALLWTGIVASGGTTGSPAVANGMVYTAAFEYGGSYNVTFYAFNASGCGSSTCAPLWTQSVGSQGGDGESSPAAFNGVVYFGSPSGTLYAFNGKTGSPLWTWTNPTPSGIRYSSPAIANGILYDALTPDNGTGSTLYAFNVTKGTPIGTYDLGNMNVTSSSPAIANGVVYIGGFNTDSDTGFLSAFILPGTSH